ncbi:MAG: hypothetical protein IJM45_08540 [Clostridia bacterium]|nr:hypothetical protein [Clostridia bacterium]
MKKLLKGYLVVWAVAVAIFNIIVFAVPNESEKYVKFGGAFWAGYALIMLSFLGQLAVSVFFFRSENTEKVFLNLPLIRIGRSCLIVSLICGAALMVIPDCPQWVGAIVAALVLGFYIIAAARARIAAEAVSYVGANAAANTAFVKEYTARAEQLVSSAATPAGKAAAEKVFEALRYSNKSGRGTGDIEAEIASVFTVFADAVRSGDDAAAADRGAALARLISERDVAAKAEK